MVSEEENDRLIWHMCSNNSWENIGNMTDTSMYLAFLDVENAYDREPRKSYGIQYGWDTKYHHNYISTYTEQVRVKYTSRNRWTIMVWYYVWSHTREHFAPLLFIVYMDLVIRKVSTTQEDHNYTYWHMLMILHKQQHPRENFMISSYFVASRF